MATSAAEMQALIDKLVLNMTRFNDITNGADTLDITVDSGLVPSISKLFKILVDLFPAKGYATVADLPSVGVVEHTIASVLQDPIAENNIFWVYLSGAWQPASEDRITSLSKVVTGIEQILYKSTMPADNYVLAWVDAAGKILGGFNSLGQLDAQIVGGQRSNAAYPGYIWVVLDSKGAILLGVKDDGSLYSASQLLGDSAYISAGRAYHVGQDGRVTAVSPVGVTAIAAHMATKDMVQVVVDKPSLGTLSSRLYSKVAKSIYAMPGKLWPIFHGEGQSLMVGSWGFTGLKQVTGKHKYAMLMPSSRITPSDVRFGIHAGSTTSSGTLTAANVDGLVPYEAKISSYNYGGQTPLDSFAQRYIDAMGTEFDLPAQAVVCSAGRGGAAYTNPPVVASDGLGPGTTPWTNTENGLRRICEILRSRGLSPYFPMLFMQHGQSDVAGVNYEGDLEEWHTLRTNYLLSLANQTFRPKFCMTQVSSFIAAFANGGAHIDQRTWVNANPTKGLIATAEYPILWQYAAAMYDNADDYVHASAIGYWKMGEYYWKAFRKEILEDGTWKPLDVVEIQYTEGSTTLSVRFNVPVTPLVLDDSVITAPASTCFGFAVEVTGGPTIVPTAAAVRDNVWVDFTLAAPLTSGVDRFLRAGLNGHTDPRTHETQPRTCLRDSDSTPSAYDGLPLYNWCIHSREVF